MKTRPLPVRTETDWRAVAETVKTKGAFIARPDINRNAAHASLHRFGMDCYSVRNDAGVIVAYSIEPKRKKDAK